MRSSADAPKALRSPKAVSNTAVCPRATWLEVQAERRAQLRGKKMLVVVGGWLQGKRYVFDRLNELGVIVTLIDTTARYNWPELERDGTIARFLRVDVDDPHNVVKRCLHAIRSLPGGGTDFDGCCTFYEEALVLCSQIAHELGLQVNPTHAFEHARNKRRTREVMAAVGLPTPRFARIIAAHDLEAACEFVGFPAVLKPVLGSGSFGVMLVKSAEDARAKYAKLVALMDPADDPLWREGTEVVLEEFFDGDEFDIDVVLCDGTVAYAKVSDNWPCAPPWFKEMGTNCPSVYAPDKQTEMVRLATDTTRALGFRNGVFHVEAKYTSKGARIVEVNARMGGYAVRDVNLLAWGVDLIEEHALTALNIFERPRVPEKPLSFIAECGLSAPYSGLMNADEGWLDYIRVDKRVLKVNYWRWNGNKVVGPEDGLPSLIVEIIVVSTVSVAEACGVIRDIVKNKIECVPITPKRSGSEKPFWDQFPKEGHPFDHLESNMP